MRYFFKLISLAVKQQMTYRVALIAGLATNLFFGLMRAFVMYALYQGQNEVNNLTIQGAITYVGLVQALISCTAIFGSSDLMKTVYTGQIAGDLLKPWSFFNYWLAKDLGQALVNFVGRGVFFMLIYTLFFKVTYPQSVKQWVLFFIALCLGWLVSYAWRFLVNLASFWTPDAQGIARIAFTVSQFLSGFIMPLRLLPAWFGTICSFTPFPSIMNTPSEIFLGTLNDGQIITVMFQQLVWGLVLVAACRVVLGFGVRKLVIQGG